MNVRQHKRLLVLSSAVLFLGTGVVVGAGLLAPIAVGEPPPEPEPKEGIPKSEPRPDPIRARLLGIAVERGRSMALLLDSDNKLKVCAEGDWFTQKDRNTGEPKRVRVVRIESESVTLQREGKTKRLELPAHIKGEP
ncbi:MAG: hypothetical protein GVY24_05075 [Planctomycetes bacterium]|jgi:hypothetical protein|nr:hypothetical protein [Planctomycetota bacterium]